MKSRHHRYPHYIGPIRPEFSKDTTPFDRFMSFCMMPAYVTLGELGGYDDDGYSSRHPLFRDNALLFAAVESVVFISAGLAIWGILKGIALMLRKVQRPKYYPQERLRRQALAKERRRIRRRTTLNAAPTSEELLAQWAKVRHSPTDMIRFGSMLCDLEAYVDNALLRDENGKIVGRNPGIRGWLNANCQPLATHYKTVMGYKAMAEKFRQAVGLSDPYPAASVLPNMGEEERQNTVRKANGRTTGGKRESRARRADGRCQNTVRKDNMDEGRRNEKKSEMARDRVCGLAKKVARDVLAECGRSQRGVKIALEARLAPDRVPPEVEREERSRQGLPQKDGVLRRFTQMMA